MVLKNKLESALLDIRKTRFSLEKDYLFAKCYLLNEYMQKLCLENFQDFHDLLIFFINFVLLFFIPTSRLKKLTRIIKLI